MRIFLTILRGKIVEKVSRIIYEYTSMKYSSLNRNVTHYVLKSVTSFVNVFVWKLNPLVLTTDILFSKQIISIVLFVVGSLKIPSTLYQMDWLIAINRVQLKTPGANFNQQNPVDGTHFSRPWWQRHGSGRVCLVTGHTSSLRGTSPLALTFFGWVRFIARRRRCSFLGECRRGPCYF